MSAQKTCFIFEKSDEWVREYFEKSRRCFLYQKDEIKNIEKRYAPVGFFEIKWKSDVKTGIVSKVKKTSEKRNIFYVNLNNAETYYMGKGILSKEHRIEKLDVVERIIDLPPIAVEFLSDIAKKGSIKHQELNKKHFLFLDGNFDMIMMLKTRGLISFDVRAYNIREYFSKINMPNPDEREYNLGNFMSTEQKDLDDEKVDEIIYKPDSILDTLEIFLQGEGIFKNIVYLPYNICKYVDKENRFRYNTLISPKLAPS